MTDREMEAAADQPTPGEVGAEGEPPKEEAGSGADHRPDALSRVMRGIQSANVDAVFGKPQHVGNRTLIPVASVGGMYGFGRGRGNQARRMGQGEGMGGGGRFRARPVAVIVVDENEVRVQPIINVNRLVVTFLVLWGIAGIIRALRR